MYNWLCGGGAERGVGISRENYDAYRGRKKSKGLACHRFPSQHPLNMPVRINYIHIIQ